MVDPMKLYGFKKYFKSLSLKSVFLLGFWMICVGQSVWAQDEESVYPSNPALTSYAGQSWIIPSHWWPFPCGFIYKPSHPKTKSFVVNPNTGKPVLKEYIVQEDDNLWNLAGEFYGKPWSWPLFLKFNSIRDPNLIHTGHVLLFPSFEVLEEIKNKTPQQVVDFRAKLEKETPPELMNEPAPVTRIATSSNAPAKPLASPIPMPTAEKTPTFKITGSKTVNISYSEAVGSGGNGTTDTGYDRHETLRLHMEGQLNDEIKISGNFDQSDLALQDDYDLTLSSKHWELYFGNFSPSLPGSQFLSSGMSTTGIKGEAHYDNFEITALYGTPQGTPFYQKFFGNQSQGPYSVPNIPIVPGSEMVWVNKQKMVRGVDYNLDYTLGNLTFINRIVQLTDLVEVTGESSASDFNTQIYGYHMQIALAGKVPESKAAPPNSSTNTQVIRGIGGIPGATPVVSANSAGVTGSAVLGNVMPGATSDATTVNGSNSIPVIDTTSAGVSTGSGLSSGSTILSNPVFSAPGAAVSATITPSPNETKGFQWIVGQGFLSQVEQPDFSVTTETGQVAADSKMLELDTTMDWGPSLKIGGEIDGSIYTSSDTDLAPSTEGAAYHLQGESFQGPFHLLGKISGATPNFVSIGNPLTSGDYLDWSAQADIKTKDNLFGQVDRSFQRNFSAGYEDDTTTDHGEVKLNPKNFPEADYVYYNSDEEQPDNPNGPFDQSDLKNTASLSFGIPGSMLLKTSALQETQNGTNLGENDSYGGQVVISSQKWKNFNFSASGEFQLSNITEATGNTLVPSSTPGTGIASETLTYTMEGKPIDHLTLTGKGTYSNAPVGPPTADLTESFKTDPWKWLNAGGSYSLDFQQTQVLGNNSPDEVHTGSGSVEATPLSWLKLSAQPTFRVDQLVDYDQSLSQNYHQYYKATMTPDFGNFSADYTLDQFWTWDGTTVGFPLNFYQQTETTNLAAKKPLLKGLTEDVSYKISDQTQNNYASTGNTTQETIDQTENDALAWNINAKYSLTFSHTFNQLNQSDPGQGNATNPLLPNGSDTFNTTFSTTGLNAQTFSNTFALRIAEQIKKTFSMYQQFGYTDTTDVLQGGTVNTYSPGFGFTWKPGTFLNWTASYQFNGSNGEVSTMIQTAQTVISATLTPGATMAINWNWTRADNPFVLSQQGTMAYTMNF